MTDQHATILLSASRPAVQTARFLLAIARTIWPSSFALERTSDGGEISTIAGTHVPVDFLLVEQLVTAEQPDVVFGVQLDLTPVHTLSVSVREGAIELAWKPDDDAAHQLAVWLCNHPIWGPDWSTDHRLRLPDMPAIISPVV